MFRAFPHTGLTLDAGTGDAVHVLRVNGPHGAQPGAGAAVRALGQVGPGFGLQELGRLAVGALGDVIRGLRVSGNGDRCGIFCQVFYLVSDCSRKFFEFLSVIPVRPVLRQFVRKGVTAHKGAPGHRMESVTLQNRTQLRQSVVIGPISEGHNGRRQRAVTMKAGLEVRQDLVRQLSRVGGRAHHHQIRVGKHIVPFPLRRLGERQSLPWDAQLLRQRLRKGGNGFFRISCGTEI